jgi:hypothetical protein
MAKLAEAHVNGRHPKPKERCNTQTTGLDNARRSFLCDQSWSLQEVELMTSWSRSEEERAKGKERKTWFGFWKGVGMGEEKKKGAQDTRHRSFLVATPP